MHGTIYCLTNKTNGKQYVGQTTNMAERLRCHRKDQDRPGVDQAIKKYGWDNFEVDVLESHIPVKKLDNREKDWVKKKDTYKGYGYNLAPGGGVLRGEDNGMYGKEPANKGTTLSEERRQKISEWTKQGTPKGSEHPFSEVTVEDAKSIISDRANINSTIYDLSDKYDYSPGIISKILRGEHWTIEEGNLQEKLKDITNNLNRKVTKNICKKVLKYREKGKTYKEIKRKLTISLDRTTLIKIAKGRHRLCPGA